MGRRSPAQKEALVAARQHHHDRRLNFTKKVYLKQVYGGRHATIEQPKDALSWQTTALRDLPGRITDFSQCRYGAQCLDTDDVWKPVLKNTRLLTTKRAIQEALCLQCQHDHEHCRLEGFAPGYGVRTRYMEEYQPGLAATLAGALSIDESPLHWEHVHAATEEKDVMTSLVRLKASTKQEAIRIVQRLHRNLGHPSAESLAELLAARGASESIIEAAKGYTCLACAKYKKPAQAAPASMPTSDQFNDAVQADVLWIKCGSTKYAIMSMVDTATRYTAAYLLRSEASEEYIKSLERMWISHFGAPNKLITDSGRPWLGHTMDSWTAAHNIDHIVAPGEAHERLAIVERRHAMIRKAVEIYMSDLKIDHAAGIREGLTYIVPQLNATSSVAGFSPSQWVLGFQPQLGGDLLSDTFQPVHFGGNPNFEELLTKRHAAKKALLDADTDRRLRRALGMKYKGINTEYQLGQKVWFWRDAKQTDLVKIRWLGPAHVVMKEFKEPERPDSQVSVYWLSFKTQLIRCAPHHVRPDVKNIAHSLEDTQEALNQIRQLRSRGVSRYYDLHKLNRRNLIDVEDDEHGEAEHLESESDHEMSPPRRRARLSVDSTPVTASEPPAPTTPTAPEAPGAVPIPGRDPGAPGTSDYEPTETGNDPAPEAADVPVASDASLAEPSEEPPVPSARPTPSPTPKAATRPALDPETASLYEPAGPETFQQQRLRMNRQETLSFAPWRNRRGPPVEPYPAQQPSTATEASSTIDHGFTVDDIDVSQLPQGWYVDEEGYLSLTDRVTDYWEVKAGCLVRHHLVPRRGRMHIEALPKDCPVPLEALDRIKVTMVHQQSGKSRLHTDDGADSTPPPDTKQAWTGCTVFQLTGPTRKELAMYTSQHQAHTSAKQEAKSQKLAKAKKFKKEKNGVNERTLGPDERALFKEAKVKELKSFFDHGVWEFQHKDDADESRTLTARMILKWSKHPDGSPRAKARLIVRGYNDPDALAGQVATSSPTTTRLSRSFLLSLAANMSWCTWTADVSTAFLQGRPQSRKLWVKLPSESLQLLGADEDTRMLLLKPCYGQIDAPRGWYLEAVDRLLRAGLRQHPLDPCCFLVYEADSPSFDVNDSVHQEVSSLGEEKLVGMIIMHVDDMLGSGCSKSPRYQEVISHLKENFSFREWKNRPMSETVNEREISQIRGLLGSVQWPAVQSSPHLQCTTSMLSGLINKATVQTLHECNRLLRFCKDNKDVGLTYNFIGKPDELQLITFFDAGFTARPDGNSQGGFVTMLVNKKLFASAEEGEYHVLDWRSFRTPRVARSSVGAEAQAGGQAADSVDFTCRFWEHLLKPGLSLQELIETKSTLRPTLVTDAKALYDSYHREGISSSVVDKRVSLEIRVMKERMECLGGGLRWMSSERQIADGLTKESARTLLAARLRHGRLKLTWDPTYTAAKKKTKAERNKAIKESTSKTTAPTQTSDLRDMENHMEDEHPVSENDVTEYSGAQEDQDVVENTPELCEFVFHVRNDQTLEYALASSHVVRSLVAKGKSRVSYAMYMLVMFTLLSSATAQEDTCPRGQPIHEEQDHLSFWILLLGACHMAAMIAVFTVGRWTASPNKPLVKEAGVQKEEQLVPQRL